MSQLAQLAQRLLHVSLRVLEAAARSGAARRRATPSAKAKATSRCWAPSCRSRSSRLRSASPAAVMSARDAAQVRELPAQLALEPLVLEAQAHGLLDLRGQPWVVEQSRAVAEQRDGLALPDQRRGRRARRRRPDMAARVDPVVAGARMEEVELGVTEQLSRAPRAARRFAGVAQLDDEPRQPRAAPARGRAHEADARGDADQRHRLHRPERLVDGVGAEVARGPMRVRGARRRARGRRNRGSGSATLAGGAPARRARAATARARCTRRRESPSLTPERERSAAARGASAIASRFAGHERSPPRRRRGERSAAGRAAPPALQSAATTTRSSRRAAGRRPDQQRVADRRRCRHTATRPSVNSAAGRAPGVARPAASQAQPPAASSRPRARSPLRRSVRPAATTAHPARCPAPAAPGESPASENPGARRAASAAAMPRRQRQRRRPRSARAARGSVALPAGSDARSRVPPPGRRRPRASRRRPRRARRGRAGRGRRPGRRRRGRRRRP